MIIEKIVQISLGHFILKFYEIKSLVIRQLDAEYF